MKDVEQATVATWPEGYRITAPEASGWACDLFGSDHGVTYYPNKGQVPNWFHRKMQGLILGFHWRKVKQ